MARTKESARFHHQLLQGATEKLEKEGFVSVQHIGIEGGGRPDIAGRNAKGKFEAIVECKLKSPSAGDIDSLRAKYKGRKLILAIPAGLPLEPEVNDKVDEIWEIPLENEDGNIVLPVEKLEIPRAVWDSFKNKSKTSDKTVQEIIKSIISDLEEK